MEHPKSMTAARTMVRHLRELDQVPAPPGLAPTVLERLGLSDAYAACDTPIGPVFVAYNGLGIAALMPAAAATDFEQAFHKRFGRSLRPVAALPPDLERQLRQRLSGTSRAPLAVDWRGLSTFERAVLDKTCEIPRGELRTYAWVAREIGHPKAVRAVGTALGHNPVPLLIPCHRVGRSDGHLGQYAFGSQHKRTLLAAEGVDIAALEHLARTGVRYYGSATTHIYCFPTCHHARRIKAQHRVTWRSEAEAVQAGYRPCLVCRPAMAL